MRLYTIIYNSAEVGESYLNVTNLNGKDQVSANMQVVHNILNGGTRDLTTIKTEMLIAA